MMLALPLLALAVAWTLVTHAISAADICLVAGLILAGITDTRYHKIFNWTTYPLILWSVVLGIAVATARQLGIDSSWIGNCNLLDVVGGIVCCGSVTLVAYCFSRGGAGDVKLAMLVGGLLGVERGLLAVGGAYILAAGFTLLFAAAERSIWNLARGLARSIGSQLSVLIAPPNCQQEALLARKTPLAGYFAIAGLIAIQ